MNKNKSKVGLESQFSMSSTLSVSENKPPTFSHYKYELVKDKIKLKTKEQITVDASHMSADDEKSSLLDSLTTYLKAYMVYEYNMEEHFIPFDSAPLKCSVLLSQDYQDKENLYNLLLSDTILIIY